MWVACLTDVLDVPDEHDRFGIVAGMLPDERATLRPETERRPWYTEDVWTGGDLHGERRKRSA